MELEEKNKILLFGRELYYKWEITEKQLYDTYYELYIKKNNYEI